MQKTKLDPWIQVVIKWFKEPFIIIDLYVLVLSRINEISMFLTLKSNYFR